MRYRIMVSTIMGLESRSVNIDHGDASFTSFPAAPGNPNYDSFLQSQSLRDAEVQAMEPDIWHDMA